jgi:hypothetical protein
MVSMIPMVLASLPLVGSVALFVLTLQIKVKQ